MKLTLLLSSFILISCSGIHRQETKVLHSQDAKAVSDLHSATMENMKGLLTIEDNNEQLKIIIEVSGLKPNAKLGFHIHENGICEGPNYKTAGAHFNPHKKAHGGPESLERHLGDMGNIETDATGAGKKIILLPKSQADDLNLIIGKSVLIHAAADDLKTQPSGDSGERIACGLIKPVN